MNRKQQITFGIIVGTVFLIMLLVLAIIIECPTPLMRGLFPVIVALSAAAFASTVPGFLNVRYRQTIAAGGALGVFVVVFLLKPMHLECKDEPINEDKELIISGNVYINGDGRENVQVSLEEFEKDMRTNIFGKFEFSLPNHTLPTRLRFHVKSPEHKIDTILYKNVNVNERINIDLNGKVINLNTEAENSSYHIDKKERTITENSSTSKINSHFKGKTGYIYLGHRKNGIFNGITVDSNDIPSQGQHLILNKDVHLRTGYPSGLFNRIPPDKGVLKNDTKVEIIEVQPSIGWRNNFVWAKVKVLQSN